MVPILGITAYSRTGKTTLLKQLIPLLKQNNIRTALIKHTHHDMDIDIPGKDSYELRKAGANQVIVASDLRWAMITETPENRTLDLSFLTKKLDMCCLDLILVEGFKHEPIHKIALYRENTGHHFETLLDEYVIAIASDTVQQTSIIQLDINQPQKIAAFIIQWLGKRGSTTE